LKVVLTKERDNTSLILLFDPLMVLPSDATILIVDTVVFAIECVQSSNKVLSFLVSIFNKYFLLYYLLVP